MIILSIPFLNNKFITKQVADYRDEFKWLEFRLDFHSNINKFPQNLINSKTVITIRDVSEGGKYPSNFSNKISFYKEIISNNNCFVDCEIKLLNHELARILTNKINSKNLILSFHDFNEKIDYKKLKYFINLSNSIPSKFLKIAININNYLDFLELKVLEMTLALLMDIVSRMTHFSLRGTRPIVMC